MLAEAPLFAQIAETSAPMPRFGIKQMISFLRGIERRLDRLAACANVATSFEAAPYLRVDSADWATCIGAQHALVEEEAVLAAKSAG